MTRVRTIDVVAAEATSRPRFRAVLVGTFAAVALALAMVGVFGVLAYSVQQRVREFGVRIAMGAASSDVMRLVLGNAARLTLIGLAVGLIAAAALTRYLSTLLYQVKPLDPVTFVAVPIVLIVTAAIAVAAPAWRAARVDPVVAFRKRTCGPKGRGGGVRGAVRRARSEGHRPRTGPSTIALDLRTSAPSPHRTASVLHVIG